MARYQVILSYDGTNFAGFQRQKKARSVQGEVENVLHRLGWEGKTILSAGRTDTGVHASGQVIAFDLAWQHPDEELLFALNGLLPCDVAARAVYTAPFGFHPRYWALYRRYVYKVFCDPLRNPLRERYAWRVWPSVDVALMQSAADLLVGEHDFAAFGTPTKPGGPTTRRVLSAQWLEVDSELRFEIAANAFLYHMVRKIVYLCIQVGQGRLEQSSLKASLDQQVSIKPGIAPAHGLTLVEVAYPPSETNNITIFAEGSQNPSAVSGDDNSGQDIRPKRPN